MKYDALSYVWGDPTKSRSIFVDEKELRVTENLYHALRWLRGPGHMRVIWVDAVCTNQNDIPERNHQVGLMGKIYSGAETVRIYLGNADHGSSDIPIILNQINRASEKLGKSKPQMYFYDDLVKYGFPSEQDIVKVRNFFSEPYFTRSWVVQEAVLARNANVFCGGWEYSWLAIRVAHRNMIDNSIPVFDGGGPASAGMEGLLRISDLSLIKSPWKLIDVLDLCRGAQATDKRDKVFAFLNLASDGIVTDLKPDNGEDARETFIRYAKYFVKSGDGMMLLYNTNYLRETAHSSTLQLPSWVID